MSWKKGPLPPDTWNWGAVVPTDGSAHPGFFFADFKGDHVVVIGSAYEEGLILEPDQIAWYNNSIDLPPSSPDKGIKK